jgi:hypothetical protein
VSCHCAPLAPQHSYFVVMVRRGRGCEAIVDPEITRRGVIERIQTREYDPDKIVFIHWIDEGVEDLTHELIDAAKAFEVYEYPEPLAMMLADWDRERDYRKNGGL